MKTNLGLCICLLVLLLYGCGLTKEELLNLTDSAQDQAIFENEFASIYDQVDEIIRSDAALEGSVQSSLLLSDCASATFDLSTSILTIDYGSSGCLCKDGKTRKGQIISVFSGQYRTQGAKVATTLQGYHVDEIAIQGVKTITNLGNDQGNYRYSSEVRGARVTLEDGTVVTWESDVIVEREQGEETITPWDDVHLIEGRSQGVNRRGIPFSTITLTALKKKIEPGCLRTFVSGILEITDEDSGNAMVLDYDADGTEACDRIATVKFNNGNEFTIITR